MSRVPPAALAPRLAVIGAPGRGLVPAMRAIAASASRRRRRPRRRRSAPGASAGRQRRADQAGRRARLHPERPVRAVLPRPAEGLLRGRRASTSSSRTRSTRTSSRSSARARSTSASATGPSVIPAVSQGIPIEYVATIYGKFPNIVFAKASSGHQDRGRPQGQEDRHPGQVRLELGHAPGAARLGRPDDRRRPDRRVPRLRPGRRGRSTGAVDAATGFANNEPVQLELHGTRRRRSTSTTSRRCPGPGLIAGDQDARDQARRDRGVRRGDAPARCRDHRRPEGRPRRGDQGRPGARDGARRPRPRSSPRRSNWAGPLQVDHALGAIDRDGWTARSRS